MKFKTRTNTAQHHLSAFQRGLFYPVIAVHLSVVFTCTIFCCAACGPCSSNGMQKPLEDDACGSYRNTYNAGIQDMFAGDVSSSHVPGNSRNHLILDSVCGNSDLFCFLSTLPGLSFEEHDVKASMTEVSGSQSSDSLPVISPQGRRWAGNSSCTSDHGVFESLNRSMVSCSLNFRDSRHELSSLRTSSSYQSDLSSCRGPLVSQKAMGFRLKKSDKIKLGSFDTPSSVHVEINPPLLDWGQQYLYFPSLAFLTVANIQNDSILHVYEPFSTDIQFYPCNSTDVLIGPGEVASICFVFLPRWLGLSSAHLILQTSSGGFLVQAKGFAVDSPYGIQPQMGLDVSSPGRWSKNLSFFNPFNETLYVEEITIWVSVSLGDILHSAEATCAVNNIYDYDNFNSLGVRDWLDVRSGQVGFPAMAVRPHKNWEIDSHSTETLIEMDFSFDYEGKIFGVFCMQLVRSSQDKSEIVMVPLEAELNGVAAYDGFISSVSVSLEVLVPCDASETIVVAISLRNDAPNLFSVVKISEPASPKLFQVKYTEGLLLFAGSVTQVAVVSYTPMYKSVVNMDCKLLIMTNESSAPQIEIPCRNIIHICSRQQLDSAVGYNHLFDRVEPVNTRTTSLGSGMQKPSQIKTLRPAEADELVLENWKSLGTSVGMSVLDDHEILFSMVQVGSHTSRWITVKNPSQQPVIMQLILNSGEIINECRGSNKFLEPPSSSSLVHNKPDSPSRYGFSIGESSLTEAYVQPNDRASFGPIFFHPSNRCGWRSSALIRNNLSGVEWISLLGYGGSLSLVLVEGSEPVEFLEFNFNLPIPLNNSPYDIFDRGDTPCACSQSQSKDVYAKNTGDLPLEVRRIEVSGAECGLDGFMVHSCRSFSLEPGESTKLHISYHTDFSAGIVHRDLELALATGILVIPMKASLPLYMLNFCKKSVFWSRVKKSCAAILLASSLMFLLVTCILPQMKAWGSYGYLFKGEKSSVATITTSGKSSCVHKNQRNDNFHAYNNMDSLLRTVEKVESSMLSVDGHPDGHGGTPKLGIASQHAKFSRGNQEQSLLSYLLSKSMAVEDSDPLEASKPANLTVRIGKDKGRRRRKRKGAGPGVTALFEVSSSQSGTSTPSSPLSPVTSLTPNRTCTFSADVRQSIETRNPFTQAADHYSQGEVFEVASKETVSECEVSSKDFDKNGLFSTHEQPTAPRKTASKPVLLHSATFPCTGRAAPSVMCPTDFLAPSSSIAPQARAPGSNLYLQKTIHAKEKAGLVDDYTYDIWGDHLSGLHLRGRSNEDLSMMSRAKESGSDSFFVRGPQTLLEKYQPRSGS